MRFQLHAYIAGHGAILIEPREVETMRMENTESTTRQALCNHQLAACFVPVLIGAPFRLQKNAL